MIAFAIDQTATAAASIPAGIVSFITTNSVLTRAVRFANQAQMYHFEQCVEWYRDH